MTVIGLIGERGREVRDFVETSSMPRQQRTVVVCATSDQPPLLRLKAALSATAIAEHFRDRGKRVLLLLGLAHRVARAQPRGRSGGRWLPARQGIRRRCSRYCRGSLSAPGSRSLARSPRCMPYFTTSSGDDMDDIIAEGPRHPRRPHRAVRAPLAERGHFPAIDVPTITVASDG